MTTPSALLPGFEYQRVDVAGVTVNCAAPTTAVGWSYPPAGRGKPPGNTPCIRSSGSRPDDATFHAGFRFIEGLR